jgi:hypothetical protein
MVRAEPSHAMSGANSRAANCVVRAMSVSNYPNCLPQDDELSKLFGPVAANSSSCVEACGAELLSVQACPRRAAVQTALSHRLTWAPVQDSCEMGKTTSYACEQGSVERGRPASLRVADPGLDRGAPRECPHVPVGENQQPMSKQFLLSARDVQRR